MTALVTESRFDNPDRAYNAIIDAHRDLDDAASAYFNAKLVLILANHIGDQTVLEQALQLAASDSE
ncbi:MAG: DNA topoisomerase IV [Hyphomicrobiales bacterium]|nr:MAG: DNA topoisomerase IV [Hyphomicrobiales bacterium]